MASKIKGHDFYVAITPYKVEGIENQYNELSVLTGYSPYQHQFYVSLHAGWKSSFGGHGCMIMGDGNPLTASTRVYVKESAKNSQKNINEMGAALELAKADIAWLFDERMWPELRQFVKDVALCGYTAMLEDRIKSYKNERMVRAQVNVANGQAKQQNNETTMTKEMKAADLIGKTIVVGDNQATIVIKSVQDNGMLSCEFRKAGEAAVTTMAVTMPNLQAMTERGLWKIQNEERRMKSEEFATATPTAADVQTDADVAEVEDIVPVVKPKQTHPQPIPVSEGSEKPTAKVEPIKIKKKGKPTTKSGKSRDRFDLEKDKPTAKYVYATYTTKKGKTGARITGFASEDDVFYAMAAELHASGSYDRDKDGNKTFYLCFGPRYAEAAKSICKVINSDKSVEEKRQECLLVVAQATQERAQKREEWKAKREERKASAAASTAGSADEKAMFELFKKFMAGDKDAMAKVGAMLKAA